MVCQNPKILIVDDENAVCDILSQELHEEGYLCNIAFDADEALARLAVEDFDVVLLDIRLPDISGMELLRKIRSDYPGTGTIMITAVNNVDTAVEAMKLGASDYVVKPFDLNRVDNAVRKILELKECLSGRMENEIPRCLDSKAEDESSMEEWYGAINDIARGVEARLDSMLNYSRIVTERTIRLAEQLGIPDKAIQRWAAMRSRYNANRDAAIETTLSKLARTQLAQVVMDIVVLSPPMQEAEESQD